MSSRTLAKYGSSPYTVQHHFLEADDTSFLRTDRNGFEQAKLDRSRKTLTKSLGILIVAGVHFLVVLHFCSLVPQNKLQTRSYIYT